MSKDNLEKRCPVCGRGVFEDVVYEGPDAEGRPLRQDGDSHEVLVFSCGHEVRGAELSAARSDRMTVEQRQSAETAEPLPEPDQQER